MKSKEYVVRSTKLRLQPLTSHSSLRTIFIVGPTASGKSKLAMKVAKNLNGEIICADSQTIRRGMDIGTAKAPKKDQSLIRHHLLDIIGPYDRYSVAEFKVAAQNTIKDIINRGKVPIIVGGTGLYVDAVLYDFQFRKTITDTSRDELERMSVLQLHKIIKSRGLVAPGNAKNPRHLIRTIESGGQSSKKGDLFQGAIVVGLDPGQEALLKRIEERVEKMFERGFIEEVKSVIDEYGEPPQNLDAISYSIALEFRNEKGAYDIEKIKKKIVVSERRYAKRQRAWLKRSKDITWFEHTDDAYLHLNNIL